MTEGNLKNSVSFKNNLNLVPMRARLSTCLHMVPVSLQVIIFSFTRFIHSYKVEIRQKKIGIKKFKCGQPHGQLMALLSDIEP